MRIKNVDIVKGETIRKVVYIKGKKWYVVLKCLKAYPYKIAHSRDLKTIHCRSDY